MEMEENANLSTSASIKDGAAQKRTLPRNISRPGKARINFWIDAIAFLTFLICTVSGAVLMRINHSGIHFSYGEHGTEVGLLNEKLFWGISSNEWAHLHNLIGWISVALVIIHIAMHWRWIIRIGFGTLHSYKTNRKKQKL